MDKFQKHIDNLISKILNEEIESKVKQITEEKGEWQEIEVEEGLKGGQKKLDVAEPKGKLDAADFKKLRSKKKETKETEEMDEWFFYDKDKSTHGDYEGDEEAEEDAEELSQNEPTYVGKGLEDNKMKANLKNKIFGSFSDEHGWFDEKDRAHIGDFDFDFDEEEYDEFEPMFQKFGEKTNWFAPGEEGKKFFDMYKDKYGPMKIRIMKGLEEEAETEEGNAFTGALADAKKDGRDSFEVDGKKYHVKESKGKKCAKCGMMNCKCNHKKETKESEKKWIQKTDIKKGALHKKLNVPDDEKIPQSKLKSLKKELMKKAEGDKKLSSSDLKTLKQVNLVLTLKGIKENENKIVFTENELIDLIENIVIEQKEKKEKSNISKKEPEGLKKTMKALNASKKENEDYAKSVVKKMKDYLKSGSNGEFSENPEAFPESNYDLSGMKEKTKKYHPSEAVDEYIDAFAYPGMTNLVYDEIKPEDEKIEMYLKGNSKTGNAVKDKDGKALGNVVPSEVGEKFMKNYKDNLYGAEQQNASYKRQPQPVDVAGETKSTGSLKKIKSSTEKSAKIFNQLESTEDKKSKIISEEMEKMKNLISYDRKTQ
jgi:hypothetical protein